MKPFIYLAGCAVMVILMMSLFWLENEHSQSDYTTHQTSMRALTMGVLQEKHYKPIVIVSHFSGKDTEDEYNRKLAHVQGNLLNTFISEYHFLQEDEVVNEDLMLLLNGEEKLTISILGRKPSLADFMEYCNKHLSEKFIIILNPGTDVYFDHSIVNAQKFNYDTLLVLPKNQFSVGDYLDGTNIENCLGGCTPFNIFMFYTNRPFQNKTIHKLRELEGQGYQAVQSKHENNGLMNLLALTE